MRKRLILWSVIFFNLSTHAFSYSLFDVASIIFPIAKNVAEATKLTPARFIKDSTEKIFFSGFLHSLAVGTMHASGFLLSYQRGIVASALAAAIISGMFLRQSGKQDADIQRVSKQIETVHTDVVHVRTELKDTRIALQERIALLQTSLLQRLNEQTEETRAEFEGVFTQLNSVQRTLDVLKDEQQESFAACEQKIDALELSMRGRLEELEHLHAENFAKLDQRIGECSQQQLAATSSLESLIDTRSQQHLEAVTKLESRMNEYASQQSEATASVKSLINTCLQQHSDSIIKLEGRTDACSRRQLEATSSLERCIAAGSQQQSNAISTLSRRLDEHAQVHADALVGLEQRTHAYLEQRFASCNEKLDALMSHLAREQSPSESKPTRCGQSALQKHLY